MRILHFYKNYYPESMGGIEEAIRQLCLGAQKAGHTAEVLTISPERGPETILFEGHRVHRAHSDLEIASNRISFSAFSKFARLAEQFDLIHYHFPWPFMDLAHFLCRIKKPTVLTYHSDIVRQKKLLKLYRPLRDRFLDSVDRIVATSPNYLATSSVLQQHPEKTVTITYGLDRSAYPARDPERIAHWRERCGERFFLFVGVLRYYKGLHILLDALAGTQFPVVIVGAGPVELELKAHAERLNLTNLIFLGALPEEDKVALIEASYAIVFPSHLRSEAFGISLLEGAMYGKPMISSEIGTGTSYINIHNETGLVVPPSNPLAFRQAMTTLWSRPELAASMGCVAETRYRVFFSSELMASRYLALYEEVLNIQTSPVAESVAQISS